jgi:DNA repair exonuclease SbcCD ATPase subunit
LEQIAPDLQAQIDRLTLALEQSRDTRDQLQPMAQGLAQLTERYTELLDRLTVTDGRHAHVLDQAEARLGEWSAIENRLQRDTADRLRELEQSIEHEWQALRQVHEEPVRQLREQAAALGETCAAAASLALQSFQRTEARLSAIEADLHGRLNQLSRDVLAALAEARSGAARPALPPAQPFPLDGVLRIHDELRRDAQPADPAASACRRSCQPPPRRPVRPRRPPSSRPRSRPAWRRSKPK